MKKVLILLFIALSSVGFSQQGYRYDVVPGSNNAYTIPHKEIKAIPYASTKTLAPTMEETTYDFAQLTGAITVSVTITPCYTGDKMTCLFKADATNRVVTFSTGFTANGTLTVLASTRTSVLFVFNGSTWVEQTRSSTFAAPILRKYTSNTSYTRNDTITASELAGGLLTIASGTDTLRLPTATEMGTQLGATAGTSFDFTLLNIASGGTALLVVGTNIVASGFPSTNTLSLAKSATVGVATFRLHFLSATAATLTRLN